MHESNKEYQFFLSSIHKLVYFYLLSPHYIYDTFNIKPSFDIYLNSIKLDTFEEEKIDGHCCKMQVLLIGDRDKCRGGSRTGILPRVRFLSDLRSPSNKLDKLICRRKCVPDTALCIVQLGQTGKEQKIKWAFALSSQKIYIRTT